jgi:hypothetical protein
MRASIDDPVRRLGLLAPGPRPVVPLTPARPAPTPDSPNTHKLFGRAQVWRAPRWGETIQPGGCKGAAWSGDGVNGMRTPTTTWKRLTRRLGRDGNPLRRRSDVIDAWLLPVAIVVFLALCPLVLALTGNWMRTANASEHRAQASWHHVQAVLVQAVPGPSQTNHGTNSWITWTPARWTAAGVEHTASVPAVSGSPAGSVVTVWFDSKGSVHLPPLTPGQAGSRVLEARLTGLAILAVVLAIMTMVVRRFLDRRRVASWEHAWLSVGPSWSRHR